MLIFRVLVIFAIAFPVFAAPFYSEKYTYYNIYGKSEDELRSEMSNLGPTGFIKGSAHYDASTTWSVSWNYSYSLGSDRLCHISDVRVNLEVTYLYPNWADEGKAAIPLRHKWDAYLVSLANHEHGHAVNGEAAAVAIEKDLVSLGGFSSCELLEEAVDVRAHKIVADYNTKDILYDERTGHGVKQGATFP